MAKLPAQGGIKCSPCKRLTFPNPVHQEAKKQEFYSGGLEQEIRGYQLAGDRVIVPRGFARQLVGILRGAGVRLNLEDQRRTLAPVDFTFRGKLHDFQEEAVSAMAARDFRTLSAPTGSGKRL